MDICAEIVNGLEERVQCLPEGFYDTFEFTRTGNNYTHPITVGLLCKVLWRVEEVVSVAVDLRLNLGGGRKFQPDLAAYDRNDRAIVFVDYESPNSSDARVPNKDVKSYKEWISQEENRAPYIIITTLPNKRVERWELRYTGKDGYNHAFRGKLEEVRKNPFEFWYGYYRKCISNLEGYYISFVNIDGRKAKIVQVDRGGG